MILLKEGRERNWYLVQEWETRNGLKARVQQCVWNAEVQKLAPIGLHNFFCGYVQVPEGKKVTNVHDIEVHGGITFEQGTLVEDDSQWIGFDMAHIGDENNQDLAYAVEECEKVAEQMAYE